MGRWWSIDPEFKSFVWQSPYVAFDNNPILKSDPRGDAAGDGNKRAEKAKEIDKKDTRSYGQSRAKGYKDDKIVDCSEFAAEVQTSTGYTSGGTNAKGQAETFKKTGEYSTELKDVQLGDQLFFTTGNGINHTAIVSDVDKNGIIYITHATVNKNQPGSIITQKLNADGSIPYWNNKFVGTGRPKLTQASEATTNESTKKTPSTSEAKVPVAVSQQDTTIYENRKSLEEVIITPRKPDTPSSIIPQ